jgi:uncharacterized protein
MVPCPICRGAVAPRAENKASPFCSSRCKLVDLGKWLDERYSVPDSSADGEPEPPETNQ